MNPEISQLEFRTQIKIISTLEEMGLEQIQKVGGTGVQALFNSNSPGRSILLRSDHDALPIHELSDLPYRSRVSGVSHMCGHDGHTAILIGVANYLVQNPITKGKVCLLFQPAEENGKGADQVLNDPNFDTDHDICYALHNLPGVPMHKVVCKPGAFTPAVRSIIIKARGKTSHAAEPEKGNNPVFVLNRIAEEAFKRNQFDKDSEDFSVVSIVHLKVGELAYGISAGYGELHLTLRCWTDEKLESLTQEIIDTSNAIGKESDIDMEWEQLEEFKSNTNTQEAFELIKEAALEEGMNFEEAKYGQKWGEDFGRISQKVGGAMFGLGSGLKTPALHNPDYDFPDELIDTGVRMFSSIIRRSL